MPVRKVTVTQAEEAALLHALLSDLPSKVIKGLSSLLAKVQKAKEPVPTPVPGLNLLAIETALKTSSRGKYAPWIAGNPAVHLRTLHQAGATEDQLSKVGRWLSKQAWMRGRVTLGAIASKWGEWLARAMSEDTGPGALVDNVLSAPAGFE